MVKRIIAIGGEPGTGKTTLIKKVKDNYSTIPFKYGLVRGEYDKERGIYFIGIYDGSTFEGSDKLSMAVNKDFLKFLEYLKDGVVVFEGDRLFNASLFLKEYSFDIYVLTASKSTLEERYKERGSNQTETFLKSRRTKIKNILDNTPNIKVRVNEDNPNIVNEIIDSINE